MSVLSVVLDRFKQLAVGGVVVVGAWWVLSLLLASRVLPAPPVVFARMVELVPQPLWHHATASLWRVVWAVGIATASALPLGLLIGRVTRADAVLSPAAYLLYPVPKIALLPVIFLVLGVGEASRIGVVVIVLFFQVLFVVRDAARAVPESYIRAVRALGGGSPAVARHVILPAVLPSVVTGLRIGTGTALAVLFFAETFFTRLGLGFFIIESWSTVAYVDMMAGIVSLSVLGIVLFTALDVVEKLIVRPVH